MSLGPAVLQFTPRRDQVLALVAHFLEMNPILVVENGPLGWGVDFSGSQD